MNGKSNCNAGVSIVSCGAMLTPEPEVLKITIDRDVYEAGFLLFF